jgi:hypothetical protein
MTCDPIHSRLYYFLKKIGILHYTNPISNVHSTFNLLQSLQMPSTNGILIQKDFLSYKYENETKWCC